ncbi:Dot/Icm secretion system substrate [Legionella steigerwaltii]|uniref:Dot/Icm secretion system substrate n=1 Tax=Legionella steigerwaltii TaxID=460 RepID=A0A378LJM7_9GAMM|nr:Dot/Icm T4SS effector AnkD/LegA15 [Legionella steigerwaltii]KTD78638.1 substrate of the Dot/Icm secretion system [Legionella steigerwaltii]STY24271.1 Dot/Icm secretion system substrate [Legionella steigerwaltii]
MKELSAPKSTVSPDVAEDKLKALQKAKIDQDLFIQALFQFLQRMFDSTLKYEIDSEAKTKLTDLAKDCGYQDLPTALNSAKNARGQSPLTQALQNQDFSLAQSLLDSGAKYDVQSMDEYGIAIHSQRGQQALQEHTITAPEGAFQSRPDELHRVKEFGLVLGIVMVSVDNTSSQRAEVGPTYALMTEAVSDYSCSNQPAKEDFEQIKEAFVFTNREAKFEFSTPEGSPEAGAALSERIKDREVTSVPINCNGHAMGLSFVPVEGNRDKTYLVFTNRGEGAKGKYGTQIYEVDTKDVTPDFINKVMSGHDQGLSHAQVMAEIHQVTKGKEPIYTIDQKKQSYDNCTIANTRANIHGVLLCQEANRRGGFENVTPEVKAEVKGRYKQFTSDMRDKKVQKLEGLLQDHPSDPDLKALAKGFMEKPNHKHSDVLQAAVTEEIPMKAMK